MSRETTDFGYTQVSSYEKAGLVAGVFSSVAKRYDLMNDIMSMGTHRLIKRKLARSSGVSTGDYVLDLAGGTGDMTVHFSRMVGRKGCVVLADINKDMLNVAQRRLSRRTPYGRVACVQADAECLPFKANAFHCVVIAFGIRNFTHKTTALCAVKTVAKPDGKLLVLDFSRPRNRLLKWAYDLYSFGCIPLAGRLFAGNQKSYRYLVESIRMHPSQEGLKALMEKAGFSRCHYGNIFHGIIAVHKGIKPQG